MPIDYDVEYNNRARVPEHPEIFARWEREAAAFRDTARGAELGLKYGPSPRQTIDLFPAANDGPDTPLAMFIHGGWWRSLDPSLHSQLAGGPNANGVTVAVVGYDLCPQVSIATIIQEVRAACLYLWRKRRQRFTVYGHSAGGHLSACMVATNFSTLEPDAPADLVPAAYAISGLFDLEPVRHTAMNQDLMLDEKSAHEASPLYWDVPVGRTLDAVVGALESSEFLRQSETVAEAWRQDAAITRYEAIAGRNHFTVIDPLGEADSTMTWRVVELARKVQAEQF
ncbi:MAG TPA: alpha/beta hydrolase [Pseudolabrys sp.]|nr:alpha/beta hydrolase [Pseudolabrys sp.]